MKKSCFSLKLALLVTALAMLALPALAWPPGGNGNGNGNGGGGGGGDNGGGATPPQFEWVSLGILPGGESSRAYAVNNSGEVVGSSGGAHGGSLSHAFLNVPTSNGGRQMIDLHNRAVSEGLIPAFDFNTYTGVVLESANDINDSGRIVGDLYLYINQSDWLQFSYYYAPATQTSPADLVILEPIGTYQTANPSINNSGTVAFNRLDAPGGEWEVFTWDDNNGFQQLNIQGQASDINNNGQIAGDTSDSAWVYTPNSGLTTIIDRDFPRANGINDSSQVVGFTAKKQQFNKAYKYDNGRTSNINTMTVATGINNLSETLGYGYFDNDRRPLLHSDDYGVIDILDQTTNAPFSWNREFWSISDAGDMVGNFQDVDNFNKAVLLIRLN